MRFYIETYGCTANFGNSNEAEATLLQMGHEVSPLAQADLVIINTCAVTQKTERKIKKRLLQLQGPRLVIAGCLQKALPDFARDIRCLMKVGILDEDAARRIANYQAKNQPNIAELSPSRPRMILAAQARDLCGIVNIAEGCNGSCSYCIVRMARGELKSRTPEEISAAVQKLVMSGCVEIQLAAQDTAAYGLDIGTTLPELLGRIAKIPGRFMIRIGMMNPDTAGLLLSELAEALCSPKVYRFIHMPLQSGSDRILKSMGRRYSAADYQRIIDYFRRSAEGISIITDVIAGYPGETDEDFQKTADMLRAIWPDKVNVTKYSSRPGTSASELYDMPDRIKKDRSRELTRLWLEMAAARNREYEGSVQDALITERGSGHTMKARTMNYTGIVIQGTPALGSIVRAKVIASNAFYLTGQIGVR